MPVNSLHPDFSRLRSVYIDETSQTKHRYLLLGGIIVPSDQEAELASIIMDARTPELPQGEMKWVKVSRSKLSAYKRVVDIFFKSSTEIKPFDFHCLAVDTHKLDHNRFNQGSGEIGFNKEIYQLAMKFGRLYKEALFHCYPDERPTNQSPNELRLILNRGIAKKGDTRDWPYRRMQFRDSSKTLPLQLVDILLGGIAYQMNGHHLAQTASPAKIELSAHILGLAGIREVMRDTSVQGKFTIWHRRLR